MWKIFQNNTFFPLREIIRVPFPMTQSNMSFAIQTWRLSQVVGDKCPFARDNVMRGTGIGNKERAACQVIDDGDWNDLGRMFIKKRSGITRECNCSYGLVVSL